MRPAWGVGAFLALTQTALAQTPELSLPVDCTLEETCFIQNYVDADPSAGYSDFSCGALSYDTHKGTDFAIATHEGAMQEVNVLAAADGVVKATRDGLPDAFLGADAPFPDNQDCGNGLVIDHGDGWQTQYCHLSQGSIVVSKGQQVEAGTPLGQIGMSGSTAFPHLHMSLRKDGQTVDPFDPSPDETCGAPLSDQLWETPIAYQAGGLLQVGFASAVPNFEEVKWGDAHADGFSAQDDALVLWVHMFGAQAGDVLHMVINGPDGKFFDHKVALDRTQAQIMRAAGRKLSVTN